jgi:hypothetical protein
MILIETLLLSEQLEAILPAFELPKQIRGKRVHWGSVGSVWLAPIKQRKQEAQDGQAVHGIARRDLANPVRLFERLDNADATVMPVPPQNGNPLFVEQVIGHGIPLALATGGWRSRRASAQANVRRVATTR